MRGLNKQFKEDPVAFLQRLVLLTLPGQPCPTCHCVMNLSRGNWDGENIYARPDATVLKFDLIGGGFAGAIPAGQTFVTALGTAHPPGLAFNNPLAKYAALQVLRVGQARVNHRVGLLTNEYSAYWLPWADQGANELHLNDRNVRFFFTAVFSGCTFAVATPLAGGVADPTSVYVTHIAWDPGANAHANWGGGALVGADVHARRLDAERAFYAARAGAGTHVRSIAQRIAPLTGLPAGPIPAIPIPALAGAVPVGDQRYYYGVHPPVVPNPGRAFIAGWRDDQHHWHFAVQKHPGGFNAAGAPLAMAPHFIMPQGVQEFY